MSFANSGAAAAQPAFLRGLALLHNFQYPQAAQAFKEAQQIDPRFAMAYWGEAMSYNHGVWREQDSLAARATLARLASTPAARAAAAPTPREADYLRALDILYATTGTKAGRDSAYADTMAALAARYPGDVDAQLFHALALLSLFPRTDSTYLRAAAIAGRALRDNPRHPGALHYVIHAYDDPAHAQLGLAAARHYSTVAVDAPHAQHMTSHIFIALGMWDDVVAANEHAIGMSHRAPGTPEALVVNCGHAGFWLQYAYLQQGRLADARRMMDVCRAGAPAPAGLNGYAQMLLRYVVDVEQPADDVADSSVIAQLATPQARFAYGYASALLALRRHDTTTAIAMLDRMRAAHDSLAATARGAAEPPTGLATMRVRESEISALITLARGRTDSALTMLRSAAAAQDALPFEFGPPDVQKPTHELLGDVLLALGRGAGARQEYELALKQTPGRSMTLLGLARAARATGDRVAARAVYAQLAANWHRADTTVAALGEVRTAAGDDAMRGSASATHRTSATLTRPQLLAVSVLPLPDTLRRRAGVDSLDAAGKPVVLRKSSNGMVCVRIVSGEADWDARCYHESFIPLFFHARALHMRGMTADAVTARMNADLRSGALQVPTQPTAGYRMLGPVASYDPGTGAATSELHVWQSIHMPFRTAAELGIPDESSLAPATRGITPFVMSGGTWWAHVMILHEPTGTLAAR